MRNGSSGVLELELDHLDQFRQGDLDAFEALFRLHQRAVYGWILRIVRNPAAAEDLTVETFWRIHRAHARFEPARGFEPWARRIATRAALDWLRAQAARERADRGRWLRRLPRLAADPGVTAEIRLKTAQAFTRLPPTSAHCGHSGRGRGAAAQRSGRGARHLRRGRQTARLSRPSIA